MLYNIASVKFAALAERQSDGRAALQYVIEIRISDDEIHFLTKELSGILSTQYEPMDALSMHRWFENQPPWCVTAPWYAVTRAAEIEGGGTIQSHDPVVATYWPPRRNEVWFLAGSREEWLTAGNEIKVQER